MKYIKNLDQAYSYWLAVKSYKKAVNKLPSTESKEVLGITERYIISMVNKYGEEWISSISKDKKLLKKLSDEVDENKKTNSIESEDLVELIKTHFRVDTSTPPERKLRKGNLFIYGEFKLKLPQERTSFLLSKTDDLDVILEVLIRTDTMIRQGQQWAMPNAWFVHIDQTFGSVDLEAFASPLNTRAISKNYCSINEIDKCVGSLGSFFDLDIKEFLKDYEGDRCVITVNPPFIEDILYKAVLKINDILGVSSDLGIELIVLFTGPGWSNSEYAQALTSHSLTVQKIHMKARTHSYEDTIVGKRIKVSSEKGSYLFFLSNTKRDMKRVNITKGYT